MNKNRILEVAPIGRYKIGDQVQLVIVDKTDLGYKAIVDDAYFGVLYYNEVFEDLQINDHAEGYIKLIRPDQKIDLTLYKEGSKGSEDIAEKILELLKKSGGVLPITSQTSPEYIYQNFGVSKKKFKMALGLLYKKRKIQILEHEIRLV